MTMKYGIFGIAVIAILGFGQGAAVQAQTGTTCSNEVTNTNCPPSGRGVGTNINGGIVATPDDRTNNMNGTRPEMNTGARASTSGMGGHAGTHADAGTAGARINAGAGGKGEAAMSGTGGAVGAGK